MKIIKELFAELESNNIAQNVALIYEKLFGIFCFILMVLSAIPAVLLYAMGSAYNITPDVLSADLDLLTMIKCAAAFLAILIAVNLVLVFIFGIIATFISINSYLRQISKIPTITKGKNYE